MEKAVSTGKIIVAFIGGALMSLLGGSDALTTLFMWLVCLDILTGAGKGFKLKKFSSSVLFWGIVNKAVEFVIIALMVKLDAALGTAGLLRNSFLIWSCICEGASFVENTAAIGAPWPDWVKNALVQLRKGFSINLGKIVQKIIDDYVGKDTEEESK